MFMAVCGIVVFMAGANLETAKAEECNKPDKIGFPVCRFVDSGVAIYDSGGATTGVTHDVFSHSSCFIGMAVDPVAPNCYDPL